jgi:hypothetical protein
MWHTHYKAARGLSLAQQLRQLGDILRDPQCLIACELIYRRQPTGFILKMDVREWLACFVMHNKTG